MLSNREELMQNEAHCPQPLIIDMHTHGWFQDSFLEELHTCIFIGYFGFIKFDSCWQKIMKTIAKLRSMPKLSTQIYWLSHFCVTCIQSSTNMNPKWNNFIFHSVKIKKDMNGHCQMRLYPSSQKSTKQWLMTTCTELIHKIMIIIMKFKLVSNGIYIAHATH